MSYKKVLIVDDAAIDRLLAKKMMSKFSFATDVHTVESAMDALDMLKSCTPIPESLPELIFLDINMPQMSGFDFLDEYNKLPEDIKKKCVIVMLSSSLHPEDRDRALASPYVYKFMSKPISAEKLSELTKI